MTATLACRNRNERLIPALLEPFLAALAGFLDQVQALLALLQFRPGYTVSGS